MALAVAGTDGLETTGADSYTASAGSDRVVIVVTRLASATPLTSLRFGNSGPFMTQFGSAAVFTNGASSITHQVWYLLEADIIGGAQALTPNTGFATYCAWTLTDADQVTPIRTRLSQGAQGSPRSLTFTAAQSLIGDVLLSCASSSGGVLLPNPAPAAFSMETNSTAATRVGRFSVVTDGQTVTYTPGDSGANHLTTLDVVAINGGGVPAPTDRKRTTRRRLRLAA